MARQKRKVKPLATIWEVSDDLWNIMQAIWDELDPPSWTGRDRIDQRVALNGIIYQMRSGCPWNHLPKPFGDHSSVHRTFQRWVQKGVLEQIWATLVESCEELGGVDWRWQSPDGAMGKARFGGMRSVRTPRIARKMAPNAV
jgi:putative transposase